MTKYFCMVFMYYNRSYNLSSPTDASNAVHYKLVTLKQISNFKFEQCWITEAKMEGDD